VLFQKCLNNYKRTKTEFIFYAESLASRLCYAFHSVIPDLDFEIKRGGIIHFTAPSREGNQKNRVSFLTFLTEELPDVWFETEIYVKAIDLKKLRAVLWRLQTVSMEDNP